MGSESAQDETRKKDQSMEEVFEEREVPPWKEQITVRAIVVSTLMGGLFCIITHKLNLTTGVVPSLNVTAGLVGFFLIKTWTKFTDKLSCKGKMFTRQENTVIQTCVVACYGIAFSGGFGSYLLAMDGKSREQTGPTETGLNSLADVKNPRLPWIFVYIFTVSFLGLFSVVPLRKIMVIDYKLTYPSGTATAVLINSFHTPQEEGKSLKQVRVLGKYFTVSFLWSLFKWFYSGDGDCGFGGFPIFGLTAKQNKFYSDMSLTYVGAGMICPHLVNVSLLLGGILSWGLMWPLISKKEGLWYPSNLSPRDLKGLFGYKVFLAIAIILGDGLYNFVKILSVTVIALYRQHERKRMSRSTQLEGADLPSSEQRRIETFMKDRLPFWTAVTGYVTLAVISIILLPKIFPEVKWYYVAVAYTIAPVLAFCNSYGCGLTDWSLAATYGKLSLFIFAAWSGRDGGVLSGLALCGATMVIVSTASDLMQDFKTGYLTLSSPRSMFIGQLLGTLLGCILAPLTFWLFWSAFDVGGSEDYPVPNAVIYRQMALIGVGGASSLPKNCVALSFGFFGFAVAVNLARDLIPERAAKYVPTPMAMAMPFYTGPAFAIDMAMGSVVVVVMRRVMRKKQGEADTLIPAVASGFICGDGLWTLPSAILALAKVKPPMCISFLPNAN